MAFFDAANNTPEFRNAEKIEQLVEFERDILNTARELSTKGKEHNAAFTDPRDGTTLHPGKITFETSQDGKNELVITLHEQRTPNAVKQFGFVQFHGITHSGFGFEFGDGDECTDTTVGYLPDEGDVPAASGYVETSGRTAIIQDQTAEHLIEVLLTMHIDAPTE